ncbi:hypothetical protein [Nocardioides sp. T2.26MG-1]|uniref:hypothetical protein n=1 Tax=Nocardioides sp. T2.26MG-1 TaxID=3041166 RepID=UPI002477C866|nr:hypothetical protein [Nocardioides sp. T2.26MG-1]CAI9419241.1 hypothetical protein HIDPHFAB_03594 [Nocardioides sp. T2.26MG-1]
MQIKLAGRPYELTPDLIRGRLRDRTPEEIQEYWVEIDCVRWPVKQVIALATGAKRSEFQSQDSRRWLQNLGFSLGAGSSALNGRVHPGRSSGRQQVAVQDLPELESLSVSLSLTWRLAGAVTLDSAGVPDFPTLPSKPGLYRYDFGTDDAGVRTYYIGESQDLARRARNYRGAKTDRSTQRTSRRIHLEIIEHLMMGGSIDFAIATEVSVDGDVAVDLRLKSARRMAENAAVLDAQTSDQVRVLNIDADLGDPEGGAE